MKLHADQPRRLELDDRAIHVANNMGIQHEFATAPKKDA
jgi:hypothetical protein